ncbi:hypothetical protein Q7P36_000559 [Cladosporium allicinum]
MFYPPTENTSNYYYSTTAHSPPSKPVPKKRIAIIGTGITGTSAACQILSAGLDATLFESNPSPESSIGGIWTRQNSDSGLQIPSEFYQFHPDVDWSCEFPRRDEILWQTRGLWERYGLRERCVFEFFVSELREVEEGSELESVDVRGKKVVVVGGGASAVEAMEFAVDHGAESVVVVTRSDKWVIPRWRLLNCLMAAVIFDPLGFCEKIIEWILRFFYYRDLPASSIPSNLKVFSKTPVCSDRFFDLLRSGTVRWLKADCHRLVESGLEIIPHDLPLSRTSHQPPSEKYPRPRTILEPCQILIYATGYTRPSLPTLTPLPTRPITMYNPPSWYLQVFPPSHPTVCALNSTWLEGIGSVGSPLIGFYTRLLCVFALHPDSRPSKSRMENWVWVVERLIKPERGLGFVTAAEVYLWFAVMVCMERGLWGARGWWVLSGEGERADGSEGKRDSWGWW